MQHSVHRTTTTTTITTHTRRSPIRPTAAAASHREREEEAEARTCPTIPGCSSPAAKRHGLFSISSILPKKETTGRTDGLDHGFLKKEKRKRGQQTRKQTEFAIGALSVSLSLTLSHSLSLFARLLVFSQLVAHFPRFNVCADQNIDDISVNTAVEKQKSEGSALHESKLHAPVAAQPSMTELQLSPSSSGVAGEGGGGGGRGEGSHDDHHGEAPVDATAQSATDSQSPPPSATAQSSSGRSPKKRRKVNHGELFGLLYAVWLLRCTALIPHLLFLATYFLFFLFHHFSGNEN